MKVRECMEKEVAPIMAEVFFIFHSCPFSYLLLFICLISLIFYWFCFSWFLAKYLFICSLCQWLLLFFVRFSFRNNEIDTELMSFQYWEKAEFPFDVIPKLGSLRVAGGTIKGYGCPGLSLTGSAIATAEMARVDASCSTFILVHSSLGMLTIGQFLSNLVLLYTIQFLDISTYMVLLMRHDFWSTSLDCQEQLCVDRRCKRRNTCLLWHN